MGPTLNGDAKCKCDMLSSPAFDKQVTIPSQWYTMDAMFLLNANRKSYNYRTVTLSHLPPNTSYQRCSSHSIAWLVPKKSKLKPRE